jgi:hypothetical protein
MLELDQTRPFGTVVGHATAKFEQDGKLFDARGRSLEREEPDAVKQRDMVIETDAVESARLFLLNVLAGGPLSKSVLYKVADENNQSWTDVTKAATLLGITKFTYNKATMWKLPEDVGVL